MVVVLYLFCYKIATARSSYMVVASTCRIPHSWISIVGCNLVEDGFIWFDKILFGLVSYKYGVL
jgi:hypothetical protein